MNRPPRMLTPLLVALLALPGCTSWNRASQVVWDHSLPIGPPKDYPTQVAISINVSPTLNSNPNSVDVPSPQAPVLAPGPYAVNLSAGDPYLLTEKVGTLFEHLQTEFPTTEFFTTGEVEGAEQLRSGLEASTPGRYDDSAVMLTLPLARPVPTEHVATPIAIKVLQLRDDSLLRNSVYQMLDKDPAKALRSTYVRDDDYVLHPGQFKFIPFAPLEPETRFVAVIADYRNQENATWQHVLAVPPRGRHIVLSLLVNDTRVQLKEED